MQRADRCAAWDGPEGVSTVRTLAAPSAASARPELSSLAELDIPLMTRILRLEDGARADARTLDCARDLRASLRRVARVAPPVAAREGSFEAVLQGALRLAYAWTFAALDALLAAGACPSTGFVEPALVDMIDACDVRVALDVTTTALRDALLGVLEAMREIVRLATAREATTVPPARRIATGV